MSHFCVMVVGEDIEKQLAPFHEFESTGRDDQYIVDVDETESLIEEMKKASRKMLKDPDGVLHYPYDAQFYRDPTPEEQKEIGFCGSGFTGKFIYTSQDWGDGKGYRPKIKFTPEGWQEVEIPFTSLMEYYEYNYGDDKRIIKEGELPDLENTHKYGYAVMSESGEVIKCVRRTNPNSKWDWYQVGGRYAGLLKLKDTVNRDNTPIYDNLPNFSWDWRPEDKAERMHKVDCAYKRDIDLQGIMDEAGEKADKEWTAVHSMINFNQPYKLWADYIKDVDNKVLTIQDAREQYHNQPIVKQWTEHKKSTNDQGLMDIFLWERFDSYVVTKEEFVERERIASIMTFAILKDGVWHEKGNMGWWACVSNEDADWPKNWKKVFDSIPDDAIITIVDCHI